MALTFPLSLVDFMDRLPIQSLTFDLGESNEISETGAGEQLTADLGPRLWQGDIAFGRLTYDEAAAIEVRLDALRQAGRSFLVHDRRRPGPKADPVGSGLGDAVPQVFALDAGNRELRLQGLPVGYVLSAGDYLSFTYGADPVRMALHRIVDDVVVANRLGHTPFFEVVPNLRPGVLVGATVTLVKPACKAVILPGSASRGQSRRGIADGISFGFVQTLR